MAKDSPEEKRTESKLKEIFKRAMGMGKPADIYVKHLEDLKEPILSDSKKGGLKDKRFLENVHGDKDDLLNVNPLADSRAFRASLDDVETRHSPGASPFRGAKGFAGAMAGAGVGAGAGAGAASGAASGVVGRPGDTVGLGERGGRYSHDSTTVSPVSAVGIDSRSSSRSGSPSIVSPPATPPTPVTQAASKGKNTRA